jgi:hypothetical protein
MNNEKFKQLKKYINYAELEGMIPSNQQFLLFRNSDEAIQAIRNNEVPGIVWTEKDEEKWLEDKLKQQND